MAHTQTPKRVTHASQTIVLLIVALMLVCARAKLLVGARREPEITRATRRDFRSPTSSHHREAV